MGIRRIWVEMSGIRVGMMEISVGMMGMRGIRVGIPGIMLEMMEMRRIRVGIREREGSISPSNFYGQLPDY